MMTMSIMILGIFFAFIALGMPISMSMFLSALIPLALSGTPLIALSQKLFTSIDSYALMAVPFFTIAGGLMDKGGVSRRLVTLANAIVCWVPGSLAVVTFLASAFFGAISGSAPATVVAIGSIMVPAMLKEGYDLKFALATAASAGILGVIIPPSITFVIFGMATGASIGDMFLGGFIPGLMLMAGMSIYAIYYGKKYLKQEHRQKFSLGGIWDAFKEAVWAILTPVIVLGGIYMGVFTPTEAAAVTILYGTIVGLFVYKELTPMSILAIMKTSVRTSAMILFIVACASAFSYVLTLANIPKMAAEFLTNTSMGSQVIFLALVTIFLLIVGIMMDSVPAILILAPILTPTAVALGINPVAFGVIMCVNLSIGLLTPPVGMNLYVAVSIVKQPAKLVINKHLFMYIFLACSVLVILMAFQDIIMFIPTLARG